MYSGGQWSHCILDTVVQSTTTTATSGLSTATAKFCGIGKRYRRVDCLDSANQLADIKWVSIVILFSQIKDAHLDDVFYNFRYILLGQKVGKWLAAEKYLQDWKKPVSAFSILFMSEKRASSTHFLVPPCLLDPYHNYCIWRINDI